MVRTDLYRYYDDEGSLLYVGVSLGAIARLQQHRCKSAWFDDVATVKIEKLKTRKDALRAEAVAIKAEVPVHNVLSSSYTEWPPKAALDRALFIFDALPAPQALALIEKDLGVETNRNHMNHQRRKLARAQLNSK
jgi:hypothetical protein